MKAKFKENDNCGDPICLDVLEESDSSNVQLISSPPTLDRLLCVSDSKEFMGVCDKTKLVYDKRTMVKLDDRSTGIQKNRNRDRMGK